VSPYEQAFNRIRVEYVEMPGLRLTARQAGRLSRVAASVCRLVLDDLVRAGILSLGDDGTYARPAGPRRIPSRSPAVESTHREAANMRVPGR